MVPGQPQGLPLAGVPDAQRQRSQGESPPPRSRGATAGRPQEDQRAQPGAAEPEPPGEPGQRGRPPGEAAG
eukprot:15465243-Alexandrium_andersonii.AAC.1